MEKEKKQKEEKETIKKDKEKFWRNISILFGVLFIGILIFTISVNKRCTGNVVLSGEEVGKKLVGYLNTIADDTVSYVSYEDLGSLYEIVVEYKGNAIPVYATKDGNYWIQGVSKITSTATTQKPSSKQVEKSDKPLVELFVMSYCPYGLQAEKGIIPVFEKLGNKIDAKIRFVHYTMHGQKEDEENYRQICIREEQGSKYYDYLKCFIGSGDYLQCLNNAGIDKNKLDDCIKNRASNYYKEDSSLSQKYGVEGSPTLVINGVKVSSGRSPAAYLQTICSAFVNPPTECKENLSTVTYSPGFGYEEGSGGGSCG